jgi:hypothetical protein
MAAVSAYLLAGSPNSSESSGPCAYCSSRELWPQDAARCHGGEMADCQVFRLAGARLNSRAPGRRLSKPAGPFNRTGCLRPWCTQGIIEPDVRRFTPESSKLGYCRIVVGDRRQPRNLSFARARGGSIDRKSGCGSEVGHRFPTSGWVRTIRSISRSMSRLSPRRAA